MSMFIGIARIFYSSLACAHWWPTSIFPQDSDNGLDLEFSIYTWIADNVPTLSTRLSAS